MTATSLPPGQRPYGGFPRFGTHFHRPAPDVPADHALEIVGAVREPVTVPLADLAALPRREQTSDFHCVAGWSATGLRWEGVPFAAFYREVVEPRLRPGATVSRLAFEGLDGYRAFLDLEDAMGDDVLIAENLDGRPLTSDHGAPVRLVSPSQYGYASVKHLRGIEVFTEAPSRERHHPAGLLSFGLDVVKPHRRARVWLEERHRYVPGRVVRPVYRLLIKPIAAACARGAEDRR